MGLLDRLRAGRQSNGSGSREMASDWSDIAASPEFDVDQGLPDTPWMSESRRAANALAAQLEASPENYAEAARVRYGHQNFGAAMVLYCKALDLIHTQYVVLNMQHRQPTPADAWIIEGFVSAAGASVAMHADAPVDDEVREATHRLRTIASMCQRVGVSPRLYHSGLDQLAVDTPRVRIDDILW